MNLLIHNPMVVFLVMNSLSGYNLVFGLLFLFLPCSFDASQVLPVLLNNDFSEQVQLNSHPPNVPRTTVQGHTLPGSLTASQANQGYHQYAPSQNY